MQIWEVAENCKGSRLTQIGIKSRSYQLEEIEKKKRIKLDAILNVSKKNSDGEAWGASIVEQGGVVHACGNSQVEATSLPSLDEGSGEEVQVKSCNGGDGVKATIAKVGEEEDANTRSQMWWVGGRLEKVRKQEGEAEIMSLYT
ncbi:hypothetical protein GOP47_0030666 [Adiantum capillus-veneris]|nr:hypothetical protein GOP47_0030666 [Adiantum capillus-veneris]